MKINTINTFFFYVHEYYKALGRCSYKKTMKKTTLTKVLRSHS